jgi:F0F1-type ATP synthase membrane subunit b/b'
MMVSLSSMILIAGNGAAHGGSFVDSLPDPMKPTFFEISFVILLLVWLHFFLKRNFFSTLGKFMDDREAEILAGTSAKAEAAKAIEVRQMEYTEKLKELRARAFEHRKVLTQAATDEKAELIDKARQDATSIRKDAADKLTEQRETAKSELIAQVDALADKMAQHLLKQA